MSRLVQRGLGATFDLFQTSTDSSTATLVGQRFDSADGREFVYVQNAGTALASGNLIMGPKPIANHQNLSVTTYTAASTSAGTPATVIATSGGTLVTANQYAGGYLIVNAGTGIGQTLKIASNSSASASGAITIKLEDAPGVALSSSDSKVCLRLNPYGSQNGTDVRTSGVIVTDHTALTGQILGVTVYPIAASTSTVATYGLIQTRGPVGCLNDATTAQGLDLMPSANTDGAVQTYVVATNTRVGVSTQAGVTTEVRQITIQL